MSEDVTEQEIRSFVGSRGDYYLGRWSDALNDKSSNCGFNVAAFFLSGFWLPYRKMYVITVVFYAIILVESMAEEVVFVDLLGHPEPPMALQRVVGLAAALACGLLGNRWYLAHVRAKVAELRYQELDEADHLKELARRGGTNLGASLGMFIGFLIIVFSAISALELLRQFKAGI
jgi:hypothetical protein